MRTASIACCYLLKFLDGFSTVRRHTLQGYYDISCRTSSMLSHAAVSFWPQAVRSLLHTQLCHRPHTTGPIRRGCPDLSLTETPHRQRGVKVITSTTSLDTDSVFLFTAVSELPLSVSERLSDGSLPSHQSSAPFGNDSDTCDLLL